MRNDPAIHRLAVLALPDVVAFDLTIATQVFGHDGHGRYRVTVCSPRREPVQTTSGFTLSISAGLDALETADTVVVPGFSRAPIPQPALVALQADHARGARVASICTGAFALARAGLLDGLRATTHWAHADALAREHPRVQVDRASLYVDEGPVLTSAGLAAGLDLCLYIYARDHGRDAGIERSRHMVSPLHRAGGQAQFIPPTATGPDERLVEVTQWALRHLHLPITVDDLARRGLQSPRTLSRAFASSMGASPLAWLTTQRLHAACRLLEDPSLSIEEVAHRCGLGSAHNLRLHFRRAYGTTPSAYRASFTY